MRICKRFRWIAVALFLFISAFSFSQVKVNIEIEGEGIVCVQDKSFQGAGLYEFEVEEGIELHFRIKPGKQFYLDSIVILKWGGDYIKVSQDSIYAERDDTLHYHSKEDDVGFYFVFTEVEPWSGESAVAYKSRDKSYMQIYRPEELFDPTFSSEVSLQSDLDLLNIYNELYIGSFQYSQGYYTTHQSTIQGNNKIIKNVAKFKFRSADEGVYENFHIIDGDLDALYSIKASFRGITTNKPPFASFGRPTKTPFLFRDCINFGDLTETKDGIFEINRTSKNLINWGSGANTVCYWLNLNGDSVDRKISNVFNFGRFPKLLSGKMEGAPWVVCPIFFSYFNDKNLVPDIELPTHEWAKGYNLESRQLIDSAFMRNLMGDSAEQDFIFEDGFYPRLRNMDERPGRLAASPILLYPGENADSVSMPFYVDTNYGVRWRSLDENIIKIEGNVGYVRHPVLKDTTVRVEAWKEDFNKHVYLTVPRSNFVYQDLMADTVCPGDSVKMITSYAKNAGWNYEVVETASAEYDTIYRMYLYHYPTYREVVHRAAVERDSMPYIYGKDTIRNFGLTELHRYQTVHGCDSITYVQLEPIDRARHFYDTLQSCGPAKFTWRGVIMVVYRTSDYIDSLSDPDKNGAKSYYHLHVAISSPYYITYTDSCYIEELPYEVAGRPIPSYGTHTVNLVSEPGCDSVCKYVLSRRWHWYRVQVRVRGEGFVNVTDTVLREDASLWLAFSASSCYRLNSLTVDGKAVPLQNRYEIRELHGDCVVEVAFVSLASAETQVGMQVCVDSLPVRYRGADYGVGEHEIVLRNAAGCDSVIRLTVAGLENTARIAVIDTIAPPCSASEIAFSYRTEAGAPKWLRLGFDPTAKSAGFRDTTMAIASTGGQTVRIALPASARPDRYGLRLWQADGTGCYVAEDALNFEIPYPSDIIVQKWNDVLAVLSSEYNGGYEFSGYQWYKNGAPLEGETRSYLYVKPYLRSTDTYAVLLERASDGLQLQSCGVKRKSYPQGFSLELAPNPTVAGEAVQVSVNGKSEAEGTIEVFDGTGKPVYQKAFRRSHTLRLSVQPGSYVVRVRDAKNKWTATGKLVIR